MRKSQVKPKAVRTTLHDFDTNEPVATFDVCWDPAARTYGVTGVGNPVNTTVRRSEVSGFVTANNVAVVAATWHGGF
jgi:hypothetical protein